MNNLLNKNTLRSKLLYYFFISLIFTLISFGFIFANSLKLQEIADERFKNEQYLDNLQNSLEEIQEPLEVYLSTFSSSSLSLLLFSKETLRDLIPDERPVSIRESELMNREVYFLIDSYIMQVDQIIEQKRGRKVSIYAQSYEDLTVLYNYITEQINKLSLRGFRKQLGEYRNFLILFRKIQMYSLIMIILIIAVAFSIIMNNVNTISNPMDQLSKMAGKISTGDFALPDLNINSVILKS